MTENTEPTSNAADSADSATELHLVPLPGSERKPAGGVAPAASGATGEAVDDGDRIEATVVLRRPDGDVPDPQGAAIPREEFATRFGAAAADRDRAVEVFQRHGLTVESSDLASRRIRVSGPAAAFRTVFGAELTVVTSQPPDGRHVQHRHRTGGLSVPESLDGIVTAVLGIDDRPQARAQFRVSEARAASTSYTPLELGEVYRFPQGTDGSGQTIAIIELGGGFAQAELDTYFEGLGIASPSVTAVGVDGAANAPGKDPSGADGEVLLDIEVAGALAPASRIVVYFAPNTDDGFLDAVSTAAHADPTPAAISISWGQSEDDWTSQALTAMDDAFVDAAALGVTVTAAAGDNGSSDGASDGSEHADFPASSPHALACGGTSLHAGSGGEVSSETVWNNGSGGGATGGGVSDVFSLPSWQQDSAVPESAAGTRGRGVPDVAANADPETGYQVLVDGKTAVYGGTSAVAPLWAALAARLNQSLGSPLGLAQPKLYAASAAPGFRDITEGDNGAFAATSGWDACTGLGVPDGDALLAALG